MLCHSHTNPESFKRLQWSGQGSGGLMRDLEGKRVHSSVSLNSCTPTCSVPCSNPHCAKMSPYFAQAKITRGTPAYATQSTGHSKVFPWGLSCSSHGLQPGLSQAFCGCSPPCLSGPNVQTKWGLHQRGPQPSQEEPKETSGAYHQSAWLFLTSKNLFCSGHSNVNQE